MVITGFFEVTTPEAIIVLPAPCFMKNLECKQNFINIYCKRSFIKMIHVFPNKKS